MKHRIRVRDGMAVCAYCRCNIPGDGWVNMGRLYCSGFCAEDDEEAIKQRNRAMGEAL